MECLDRGWRWRAVRERLGDPLLLIPFVIGIILVVASFWATPAVAVIITGAGTALILLFAVYPLISSATIGEGGFNFTLSRTTREADTRELYERHGDRLARVAQQLGSPDVSASVREAMADVCEVSGLIPRGRRLRFLICELVDDIQSRTTIDRRLRDELSPSESADLSVALLDLSFDTRCAYVLTHTARLDGADIAAILHTDVQAVNALVADAERQLTQTPTRAEP